MSSRQHPHDHPSGARAPYALHSTWDPSPPPAQGQGQASAPALTLALPYNDEAEKGVLSCFFHDPNLLSDHQLSLPEACFHHPGNRLLYQVIKDLHNDSCPVEYISLSTALREGGHLAAIGGPAMLSEIVHFVPTPQHFPYYKGILKRQRELRSIITACTETVARAYEPHEEFEDFRAEVFARFAKMELSDDAQPEGVSVVDLLHHQPNPEENLLGDGWLRRGGGAIFVGSSGIGKSSASMQQDIAWALGREAFGIQPPRGLRILTIQSENDRDDLHAMSKGVMAHFGVTDEELTLLQERTRYETWTTARGDAFLVKLRAAIRRFRPELVRVDPLQGFAGCKIEDSEQIANFLRGGITPILEEFRCGMIVAHHTPKPRQDMVRTARAALDFAYYGAGGAEITNWARAILAVEPKGEGVFAYHAAKRGAHIGWKDDLGFSEFTRYYRHSREEGTMYWEEITDLAEKEAAALGAGKKDAEAAIMELIPLTAPIERGALITAVNKKWKIGVNTVARVLRSLLDADNPKLYSWKIPRPRTNPVTKIWTSPQGEE